MDPWSADGDLTEKFRQANLAEGRSTDNVFSMETFPWARTEWAPRHWGAPGRIAAQ